MSDADTTQYALSIWLDGGKLHTEPATPGPYHAADAGTLSDWLAQLKVGARITCPGGDEGLLDRVAEKLGAKRD